MPLLEKKREGFGKPPVDPLWALAEQGGRCGFRDVDFVGLSRLTRTGTGYGSQC